MLVLKSSVSTTGVQPEIWFALGYADALHRALFDSKDIVVTSLTDGQHNPGSLHPLGRAADIRTKDLTPDEATHFYQVLKGELDARGYDVLIEGAGNLITPFTTGAHVHIEWDPKGAEKPFIEFTP